jgi:hypothetical protein
MSWALDGDMTCVSERLVMRGAISPRRVQRRDAAVANGDGRPLAHPDLMEPTSIVDRCGAPSSFPAIIRHSLTSVEGRGIEATNMEVRDRQQLGLAIGEPLGAGQPLALRAVPVAARNG